MYTSSLQHWHELGTGGRHGTVQTDMSYSRPKSWRATGTYAVFVETLPFFAVCVQSALEPHGHRVAIQDKYDP